MDTVLINKIQDSDIKDVDVWINEAAFGFQHISAYCDDLPSDAKILEVGCGSGILLHHLIVSYDTLSFEGIEPFCAGFHDLVRLHQLVKDRGTSVINTTFESFEPKHHYDLIYCVNVMEHLIDWKQFLSKAAKWLSPGGRLVFLCPNYGFPYESHFLLPIIINKEITYKIFKNYIHQFEDQHQRQELWHHLNFITKKQVKQYIKTEMTDYKFVDHDSVMDQMIDRITTDKEFGKRHRFMGAMALLCKRMRLVKLLTLFPNQIPYMKIELIKST